jgi:uncharacterized protein YuzE
MKLPYYPETDSLSIELKPEPSVDSREVADGIVLDVDAEVTPVGIDIDGASQRLDLTSLEATALPLATTAA